MWSLFQRKPRGKLLILKIGGMHCPSCAMNIDAELEELAGVISATTSYAKSETKLEVVAEKVSMNEVRKIIRNLGYQLVEQ